MSKQGKGFTPSAMPAEEAEEMSSRKVRTLPDCPFATRKLRMFLERLGTSVYGSSVGSAKRRPQMSFRQLLQELSCIGRTHKCVSNIADGELLTSSEKLSFRLSGLKQKLQNYVFIACPVQFNCKLVSG